ncbi:MAG: hypothetical protein RL235_107 [Chlamydiota bacterium]|jgi:hypothetical protein
MRSLFFKLALLCPLLAVADGELADVPQTVKVYGYEAWFTGPILTPSALTVPGGHINFESYFFATATTGAYNNRWQVVSTHTFWSYSFQPQLQIGYGNSIDFSIQPALFYNRFQGQTWWGFGDLPLSVDFNLYEDDLAQHNWYPNVKITLKELLPTGKWRNLNPKRLGTDGTGGGSFVTAAGLGLSKLIHLTSFYYMSIRAYGQYSLPAKVHVKGYSVYGGGRGTNARFFPAQNVLAQLGLEISMSRRWVLACDLQGSWSKKERYSGNPGRTVTGEVATLGLPSAQQYSLAPAIEYNWNSNLGVIGGGWFSFAGKNSPRFWSAVFAINYFR